MERTEDLVRQGDPVVVAFDYACSEGTHRGHAVVHVSFLLESSVSNELRTGSPGVVGAVGPACSLGPDASPRLREGRSLDPAARTPCTFREGGDVGYG